MRFIWFHIYKYNRIHGKCKSFSAVLDELFPPALFYVFFDPMGAEPDLPGRGPDGEGELVGVPINPILAHTEALGRLRRFEKPILPLRGQAQPFGPLIQTNL